jgi:hypothetical protein
MTSKQESLAILRAARELLARPNGWTRRAYARDEANCEVPFNDPRACRFCSEGAIMRGAGPIPGIGTGESRKYGDRVLETFRFLESIIPPVNGINNLARWNDQRRRSQRQVLALFDKAIAKLEAENA